MRCQKKWQYTGYTPKFKVACSQPVAAPLHHHLRIVVAITRHRNVADTSRCGISQRWTHLAPSANTRWSATMCAHTTVVTTPCV